MNRISGFKRIAAFILKVLVAGVSALAILSVISFFYIYTGIHVTNTNGATDYVWQKNQLMVNMKEGFSFVEMDENGFNNAEVFDDIDILLMGSSHMESYQVLQNENCASLLNEYLSDLNTYNIGISGHTIYRIVDNIEFALNEFSPSKYLLIETNTVQLNVNKMNEVLNGDAKAIESHDSGILFYLQKIPAFKPLYNQFDNWLNIKSVNSDDNFADDTVIPEGYVETLSLFLSEIKKCSEMYGVTPLIFYAPNEFLDSDGRLHFSTDSEYYEIYKNVCESYGIVFVDMSDSFKSLYENKNVLAHGFSNTAVGTGHLNKYGHEAVAKTLAAEISKKEAE